MEITSLRKYCSPLVRWQDDLRKRVDSGIFYTVLTTTDRLLVNILFVTKTMTTFFLSHTVQLYVRHYETLDTLLRSYVWGTGICIWTGLCNSLSRPAQNLCSTRCQVSITVCIQSYNRVALCISKGERMILSASAAQW